MRPRPWSSGASVARCAFRRFGRSAWRHLIDEWFGPPEATPCKAYTAWPQRSSHLAVSKSLFLDSALLPDGWAQAVRVEIAEGRFSSVQPGAQPQSGDERVSVALPGMCNVHSHGFQRGMAGLTEFRGPAADNFWSWRTLMYRFVARMTPDDIEAVTAQAYVEMLESGFTRVGEFHYVHHDPKRRDVRGSRGDQRARGRGGGGNRHRPHIAAGVLRARRLRRGAAQRRPAPLRHPRR